MTGYWRSTAKYGVQAQTKVSRFEGDQSDGRGFLAWRSGSLHFRGENAMWLQQRDCRAYCKARIVLRTRVGKLPAPHPFTRRYRKQVLQRQPHLVSHTAKMPNLTFHIILVTTEGAGFDFVRSLSRLVLIILSVYNPLEPSRLYVLKHVL